MTIEEPTPSTEPGNNQSKENTNYPWVQDHTLGDLARDEHRKIENLTDEQIVKHFKEGNRSPLFQGGKEIRNISQVTRLRATGS